MLVKRLMLAVISLVAGTTLTFVITLLLGTTPAEFGLTLEGIPYFLFTALSFALAIAIWLDKFMGTEILPK
ncbi:MAG: hypothetical protein AB1791_06715 [Chloroflexota bacterium]